MGADAQTGFYFFQKFRTHLLSQKSNTHPTMVSLCAMLYIYIYVEEENWNEK
jgi:hypothetical protein